MVTSFGKDGMVDLKLDDDQEIDLVTGEVGLHAAPVVAKDVVIVGAAHRSGGVPRARANVKGFVRGFDVRTGKRLWIFHTLPKPGETGYNTWENDSADYTGNTGVWGQMSVDEDLGLVYLPVELPTGDYYGGHRPGNGLFGESVVAVDLHTGVRKWHYQLVHHGIWDMDIPCAPMLQALDENRFHDHDDDINGKTVKLRADRKGSVVVDWMDAEPREPRPAAAEPVVVVLGQSSTQTPVGGPSHIHDSLSIMQ
jgi:quinoprotein glucose dehydrogenase